MVAEFRSLSVFAPKILGRIEKICFDSTAAHYTFIPSHIHAAINLYEQMY